MVTITYTDDLGNVTATFDNVKDFTQFKEDLRKKAAEAEAAIRLKKMEAEKMRQEEEELKNKRQAEMWAELKVSAKDLVDKARAAGVTPSGVLELIKSAIYDVLNGKICSIDLETDPEDKPEAEPDAEPEAGPNTTSDGDGGTPRYEFGDGIRTFCIKAPSMLSGRGPGISFWRF